MHLRELDANLIVILDALLLEASVTKAAERLGRSPSAVSHALARLREVFDDPLFVRAGQRLVPTSRATQLAPTVHVIVAGLEGLLNNETVFDPHAQERSFLLACQADLELTLLTALRTELAALAPGVTLHRRDPYSIVDALRAGRIDLAISQGNAETSASDISVECLFEEPVVALAPEACSTMTTALALRDGLPVFADAGHVTQLFDTPRNPPPAGLEQVASPLIAIHAAFARGGIALVPASIGALARKHIRMTPIFADPSLPPLAYRLMWHLRMERDACHVWLRDQLRHSVKTLEIKSREPSPVEPA